MLRSSYKAPIEAYLGDAPYVFVSYSHQDKEAVFIELVRLKKLGFNVWFDEGLSPGSRWSDELAERIANCSLFLYFVTPRSADSINCQDEANYVLEAGNPFLAVHLEETQLPPGLQLRMGSRQAILRHAIGPEDYQKKLYSAISRQAPDLIKASANLREGFRLDHFKVEPLPGAVTGPDGEAHRLEPKVMAVLVCLAERVGELVSRDELLNNVWRGQVSADELLTRAISELRRVLHENSDANYIETVPKRGYRLIGNIEVPTIDPSLGTVSQIRPISQGARRIWSYAIIGIAMLALAFFVFNEIVNDTGDAPSFDASDTDVTEMVLRATSRPRPLTSMEGLEVQPAMSPDGAYVAFMWQKLDHIFLELAGDRRGDIYVTLLDGDVPKQLTATEQAELHPTWSPDGTRIAFLRKHENQDRYDIVVKPVLGGSESLVHTAKGIAGLDWSPNGKRLAYVGREDQSDEFRIYLVSMETGERSQFTPQSERIQPAPPVFSTDGRSLAYIRFTQPNRGIVCIRDIDGKNARCITPEDQEWLVFDMDWTADDTAIVAVVGWLSGGRTALRIPVTGGEPVPLPFGDGVKYVSIARSGGPLVYSDGFQDTNLWRVPGPAATVSSEPSKLRQSSTWDEFLPAYSADGTRLAFTSARSGNWEIWVSDADGSNPRQVTRMGQAFDPRWHPDGRQLIFSSAGYRDGISNGRDWNLSPQPQRIYTVDVSGGFPKTAIGEIRKAMTPRWSVDGQWFYFTEMIDTGCGDQLFKRNVSTGEETLIGDCFAGAIESPDGRIYFAEDYSRIRSMPLSGGEARVELGEPECVFIQGGWTVWQRNLIYADCQDLKIKMLDLDTRETRVLADVYTEDTVTGQLSLDVSPDGQWITYTRLDRRGSDLMLVEQFH